MKKEAMEGNYKLLNELHALSAGNKAYYTWTAHAGIEVAR
jgi:hypothetical protein